MTSTARNIGAGFVLFGGLSIPAALVAEQPGAALIGGLTCVAIGVALGGNEPEPVGQKQTVDPEASLDAKTWVKRRYPSAFCELETSNRRGSQYCCFTVFLSSGCDGYASWPDPQGAWEAAQTLLLGGNPTVGPRAADILSGRARDGRE